MNIDVGSILIGFTIFAIVSAVVVGIAMWREDRKRPNPPRYIKVSQFIFGLRTYSLYRWIYYWDPRVENCIKFTDWDRGEGYIDSKRLAGLPLPSRGTVLFVKGKKNQTMALTFIKVEPAADSRIYFETTYLGNVRLNNNE